MIGTQVKYRMIKNSASAVESGGVGRSNASPLIPPYSISQLSCGYFIYKRRNRYILLLSISFMFNSNRN